jgi:hypothetical protein
MRLWGPLVLLVLTAVVAINVALYTGGLSQVATYFSATSTPLRPRPQSAEQLPPVRTEPAALSPPAPIAVRLDAEKAAETCAGQQQNRELAGRVVRWGADHLTDDAGACCRACSAHSECNVWVFCPPGSTQCTPRQCWLKHQALFAGLPPGVMSAGPATPWTSGHLARFLETAAPDAAALGLTVRSIDPTTCVNTPPPRARECGSPASDAYVSVKPACLEASATAKQFDHSEAARMAQVVWIEEHASYDGVRCYRAPRDLLSSRADNPPGVRALHLSWPWRGEWEPKRRMLPPAQTPAGATWLTRGRGCSASCPATRLSIAPWASPGASSPTPTCTPAATAGLSSRRCLKRRR